jgi:hypothetical protein
MCSLARVDRKHANECTTGNMPRSAMPPAADTMCISAMPHSMNRCRQLRLERFDAAVRQQVGVHHDDLFAIARHASSSSP